VTKRRPISICACVCVVVSRVKRNDSGGQHSCFSIPSPQNELYPCAHVSGHAISCIRECIVLLKLCLCIVLARIQVHDARQFTKKNRSVAISI
jgi:hypothetical protein